MQYIAINFNFSNKGKFLEHWSKTRELKRSQESSRLINISGLVCINFSFFSCILSFILKLLNKSFKFFRLIKSKYIFKIILNSSMLKLKNLFLGNSVTLLFH
ncbi:hypothetical protein Cj8486_1399c [Campylobacter jejuni subsp. jejuni CG8486]|nr:hypothetical protein Cj8486_1399c [Campylobacter jejuni subsp. jejuni CG8486]